MREKNDKEGELEQRLRETKSERSETRKEGAVQNDRERGASEGRAERQRRKRSGRGRERDRKADQQATVDSRQEGLSNEEKKVRLSLNLFLCEYLSEVHFPSFPYNEVQPI